MRLVFAGTPATAMASLTALLNSKHEVVAVVTRPDAPAGRGQQVAASPIARHAADAGIEVLRPASRRSPSFWPGWPRSHRTAVRWSPTAR